MKKNAHRLLSDDDVARILISVSSSHLDRRVHILELDISLVNTLLDLDLVLSKGLTDILGSRLQDGESLLGGQVENVTGLLDSRDVVLDNLGLDNDISVVDKGYQGLDASLDGLREGGAVLLQVGRQRVNLGQNLAAQLGKARLDTGRGVTRSLLDILLELLGVSTERIEEGCNTGVQGMDLILGLDNNRVLLNRNTVLVGSLGDGRDGNSDTTGDTAGERTTQVNDTGGLVALAYRSLF